jgi:energy-coupling factor transporter ATP-binding protein EcfA2
VKKFLGNDFSYKVKFEKGVISTSLFYNNEPFKIDNLSPGQKTLFAYAVLFFFLDLNKGTNIKDSIIIIDEPEKHLHPEAQIKLINSLKEIVSEKGQLWIATHSVHILSHLELDEIFMVDNGKIIPPSKTTPGKSLIDLMGIDEYIEELATFINSTSEWAYANFMLQCFNSPDVIFSNNKNDPQFNLFKKFISNFKFLNLLDYGAGKGRIGYTIGEDEKLKSRISYSAFEPNIKHTADLRKVPNIRGIYLHTESTQDNFFDIVLLCNVLHEIPPQEWIDELREIKRILKPTGYLLIIEDKFLPKGETAHECGYLILGLEELKILFNCEEMLNLKLNDERYKERILFCAIKKGQIKITNESLINALKALENNSFNQLKQLRNSCQDVSQGRLYANQTQLYINSKIAIEILTNSNNNLKT